MMGNDWMDIDDMVGRQVGETTTSVVDKYVQRVRHSESSHFYNLENPILADVMLQGHTLVYDEFTRVRFRTHKQ